MTDFLDEKRQEITSRLKELRPLVDEFNRLEAAAAALAGVIGSAASDAGSAASAAAATVTRRRGPGRPRGSASRKKAAKAASPAAAATAPKAAAPKAAKPAKRRAGRRKGSGTRAAEARSFVQGQPGITIPELAAKMGIKQNYLYRVLPGLEQENKVEKKGRGWYPKS